jgi:hypothetical protein
MTRGWTGARMTFFRDSKICHDWSGARDSAICETFLYRLALSVCSYIVLE